MKTLILAISRLLSGMTLAANAFATGSSTARRYLVTAHSRMGALVGVDIAKKAKVNATNARFGVHWRMSYANAVETKPFASNKARMKQPYAKLSKRMPSRSTRSPRCQRHCRLIEFAVLRGSICASPHHRLPSSLLYMHPLKRLAFNSGISNEH